MQFVRFALSVWILSVGAFACLRKAPVIFYHVVASVCVSACISVDPIGRISMKFNIGDFCYDLSRKSKSSCSLAKISGNRSFFFLSLSPQNSCHRLKCNQAVRTVVEVHTP